jgi:hypothetical protein
MPPSRARVRFTIEQAKQAGLNSGVWRSYPMAMLANRAMSQACRMAAPSTFMGVYDPEEIDSLGERPRTVSATGPGIASVGYDTIPEAPQIEAAPPLPPKVEAMRARLEANGWLPDAIAHLGEPAGWNLADVAAWGKARREEIEAAAAKVAAFGESGGEE